MIRKYQNELIVLVAFLVLLGGFLYQRSMTKLLDVSLTRSKTAAKQITDIKTLQKVWYSKGLKKKVASLHDIMPSSKIKTFNQEKKKISVDFIDMTGKELNLVATKIASLPVHIQEYAITRTGDKYELRCRCSW